MAPEETPITEKVVRTIPLTIALPILAACVSGSIALYDMKMSIQNQREDINHVYQELDKKMVDRFKGQDMDRFIERLQRNTHESERDDGPIKVPDWRVTKRF